MPALRELHSFGVFFKCLAILNVLVITEFRKKKYKTIPADAHTIFCWFSGLPLLALHLYLSGFRPIETILPWLRATILRLTARHRDKLAYLRHRVVVPVLSHALTGLTSVIHAAFLKYNDFACCSNNKWLYVFIPVRWTPHVKIRQIVDVLFSNWE